jgi:hypothetical protein
VELMVRAWESITGTTAAPETRAVVV